MDTVMILHKYVNKHHKILVSFCRLAIELFNLMNASRIIGFKS